VLEHQPIDVPKFDLVAPIRVRTAMQVGRHVYMVLYHPNVGGQPAAAVVDLQTGLAQVVIPFTVHGMPAEGMDGVTWIPGTTTLAWWRGDGGSWGEAWNFDQPWVPFPYFGFVP
jgi:hypothetical protein